jgi:hypothetical protein
MQPPAADLEGHGHVRLSYQQAEALFSESSGGATLHQFRHSALPTTPRTVPARRC